MGTAEGRAQRSVMCEDELAATHGSRIIEALEEDWSAIRERHPQVPRQAKLGPRPAGTSFL